MTQVICISNQKGGSGKTTSSFNLGAVLALEHGKKVLMVDGDGQSNLTTAFGFNPDDFKGKSLFNLMSDLNSKAKDFIVPTPFDNLDIIPSCQDTFMLDQELVNMTLKEFRMDAILKPLKKGYDYIFIDTPPHLGHTSFNAFVACNLLIVVYTADTFALDGISQMLETVGKIRANGMLNVNDLKILGHLWNMHETATTKINKTTEEDLDGVDVLNQALGPISRATVIKQSQAANQPVTVFDAKHKVSEQYRKLADDVLKLIEQPQP